LPKKSLSPSLRNARAPISHPLCALRGVL
jgi:hypothetical protein